MYNYRQMSFYFVLTALFIFCGPAVAEHTIAHTHIGINPTWRPDWSDPGNPAGATDSNPDDNDKLWFFSVPPIHPVAPTPGWPEWAWDNGDVFLQLHPIMENGNPLTKPGDSSKQLWQCDFMYSKDGGYGDTSGYTHIDGWHSAFGPQGVWNLADTGDSSVAPDWDIYLKREGTSVAEDDFVMFSEGGAPIITANGDTWQLGKEWMIDRQAWGIHEHMTFNFWLGPEVGQEVTATFSAYDAGGMYSASDNYEFRFVTVPEPTTLSLLSIGIAGFIKLRKKC
jgi:hypothetical protein